MPQSLRSWPLSWLLVLMAGGAAVFFSGLHGGYFADDFAYFFDPPSEKILYYFNHQNPGAIIYRPLQSTFLAIVQTLWGLEPLPIHLVGLLCHVLLCWLVAISVVRLGYSRLQGQIASVYFLVAQINTYTVLGIDTLSQCAGVAFGTLAAWLLYFPGKGDRQSATEAAAGPPLLHFLPSLLCYSISLLFKETSTSYLGVIAVALLAANMERTPRRAAAFRRTLVQLLPFLILVAIYMVVRSQFVQGLPQFGEGRYGMNIGLNIPKNIALFLAASSTPVSSVTTFVALHQKDLATLASAGILAATFMGLVLLGLWKVRRDTSVAVLVLLYFTCYFPIILFNHVSEIYLYNSFPFLASLVGIGLGGLYLRTEGATARKALAVVMGLLLVVNVFSIQGKAREIVKNGERSFQLMEQLRPFVESAPPKSTIYMLNPANSDIEYSVYRMNDFNVLIAGGSGIPGYIGRDDVTMEIRNQPDLENGLRENDSTMIVTIDKGMVVGMENGRIIPYGSEPRP